MTSKPCLTSQRASLGCSTQRLRNVSKAPARLQAQRVSAAAASAEYPDMNKRVLMNWLLAGAAALPIGGLAVPFAAFFVPPR